VAVAFELVKKTQWVFDNKKKEKWQRKSPTTKNEHTIARCSELASRTASALALRLE
jgi:hypothetical protein